MKRLILIGLFVAANQLFAAAATVLFTQNKVVANRNGSERTLSRGASLDPGDQITTVAGGSIHLQYSNGTLVNIGSNSTYKILAYSPNQKDAQINAELSRGKVEIQNTGKIKETLKTPIVSLAILGTHIRVAASLAPGKQHKKQDPQCAGRRGSEVTNVQILEGLVSARGKYLKPGDSVRVSCDRIVDAPFPPEGVVVSPLNSSGKIEAVTVGATVESGSGGAIGAQITTFVATNLDPGLTSLTGVDAVQAATSMADISLACMP